MVNHLRAGMAAAALLASPIAADAADLSMTPIYKARPAIASAAMPHGAAAGHNWRPGPWPVMKDSAAEKPPGFLSAVATRTGETWLATLRRRLAWMLADRWQVSGLPSGTGTF
jgi:hypothetical protein